MSDTQETKETKDKRARTDDDTNQGSSATKFVKSDETKTAAPNSSQTADEQKAAAKAALQARVIKLMNQLTVGCGRRPCSNKDCAGNPSAPVLAKPAALTRALALVQSNAEPCPPFTATTTTSSSAAASSSSSSAAAPSATPAPSVARLPDAPQTVAATPVRSSTPLTLSSPVPFSLAGSGQGATTDSPLPSILATPAPLTASTSAPVASSSTTSLSSSSSVLSSPAPLTLSSSTPSTAATPSRPAVAAPVAPSVVATAPPLTLDEVKALLTEGKAKNDYTPLIRRVGAVYGEFDTLSNNFMTAVATNVSVVPAPLVRTPSTDALAAATAAASSSSSSGSTSASVTPATPGLETKEKKETKSPVVTPTLASSSSSSTTSTAAVALPAIDFAAMDAMYDALYEVDAVRTALATSIARAITTAANITIPSASEPPSLRLRGLAILLEYGGWKKSEDADALKQLVRALSRLTTNHRSAFAEYLSYYPIERLESIVGVLQQYLTLRWLMTTDDPRARIGIEVTWSVIALGLAYDANERRLKRHPGATVVPFESFYNDAINNDENFDLHEDFKQWKSSTSSFAFARHPYVLGPAAKAQILRIDAVYQMRRQIRDAMIAAGPDGQVHPYLIFKVRRDQLLQDTMRQVQRMNTPDFKKPLKVQFVGEEGIDEGGVQKEFFQLIVQQILDPKFGMFVYEEESHMLLLSPHSLENGDEFELIGIILGLAIYNSVILDVHFPPSIYRKLLGLKSGITELKVQSPSIGRGLEQLLEYDGDVESTYMRTFAIQETNPFGEIKTFELKKDGAKIALTNDNRREYFDLMVQWYLEKSIEKQLRAFENGFYSVCGGPAIKLCRAEELELLICGSPKLDFDQLQEGTQYEEPFNEDHRVIKDFWAVVHEMKIEDKKQFLQFCTGSDRVPIKGLSNLRFTVSRNGPDADRLPTAHTCFNHLMLPEYSSREKLRKYLMLAIVNAKGFGLR